MGKAPCTMLLHCLHLGQLFLTKPDGFWVSQNPTSTSCHRKSMQFQNSELFYLPHKKAFKKKKSQNSGYLEKSKHGPMSHSDDPLKKKPLGNCRNFKKSMNLKMTETLCFMSRKLHEHLKAWETNWSALLGLYYSIQRSPCCLLVFTWNLTKGQTLDISWSHSFLGWWCNYRLPREM